MQTLFRASLLFFVLVFLFSLDAIAFEIKNVKDALGNTNKEISCTQHCKDINFYGVKISRTASNDGYTGKINNRIIFQTKKSKWDAVMPEYFEVAANFPEEGMTSLLIDQLNDKFYWYETHLLTKTSTGFILCSIEDKAAVDPGSIDLNAPVHTFVIPDEFFSGHELKVNNSNVLYNPTAHYSPVRLVCFDNGTWKIDKIGEFKDFYNKLIPVAKKEVARLQQLSPDKRLGDYDDEMVHAAITLMQFYVMIDQDTDECLSDLRSILPNKFKSAAGKLFADIVEHNKTYNPLQIKTYTLTGNPLN